MIKENTGRLRSRFSRFALGAHCCAYTSLIWLGVFYYLGNKPDETQTGAVNKELAAEVEAQAHYDSWLKSQKLPPITKAKAARAKDINLLMAKAGGHTR